MMSDVALFLAHPVDGDTAMQVGSGGRRAMAGKVTGVLGVISALKQRVDLVVVHQQLSTS